MILAVTPFGLAFLLFEMYLTEGIILKKSDAGETGAVFTVYTKSFGKLRMLAQGVKKETAKLKGHLEPLSLTEVGFVLGKNGERLTRASMINYWPFIKRDYEKSAVACRITDLVDKSCFPGQTDGAIWEFLVRSFSSLDQNSFSPEELANFYVSFENNFSDCLGYAGKT